MSEGFDWQNDDDGDLPWMLTVEENEEIEFEVKLSEIEKSENERGWSCLVGPMRNIEDGEGDSIASDGDHEIPFWAKKAFIEASKSAKLKKGWAKMTYTRKMKGKLNKAVFG